MRIGNEMSWERKSVSHGWAEFPPRGENRKISTPKRPSKSVKMSNTPPKRTIQLCAGKAPKKCQVSISARTFGYFCTRVSIGYLNGYPGIRTSNIDTLVKSSDNRLQVSHTVELHSENNQCKLCVHFMLTSISVLSAF